MSQSIQKFTLKKLGVFKNCSIPQTIRLLRYNLIYGFNGSGKTTLSRVFGSLEAGVLRTDLPDGGMFDIQLSDGVTLKSTGDYSALKDRLLVFNVDFVEDNFKWKEGTANPIFHLGREQVELAKHLKKVSTKKNEMEIQRTTARKDHTNKNKAFADYKRITAKSISDHLSLVGRSYEAPNLASDYSVTYGEAHKLSEDERRIAHQTAMQKTPFGKLDLLDDLDLNTWNLVNRVQSVLNNTIGDIVVEDLRSHDLMLTWIQDGLIYHENHGLSSCLFCGNGLTKNRLQSLQDIINGEFNKFTHAITTLKAETQRLWDSCVAMEKTIPSINDLSPSLRSESETAASSLKNSLKAVSETAQMILGLLAQKLEAPNSRIDLGTLDTTPRISSRDESIARQIVDLNNIITKHNVEYSNFDNVKAAAKKRLKEHYLSLSQMDYLAYQKDEKNTKTELDCIEAEYISLLEEEEQLKKDMRKHGPAAEKISKMIRNYLGRTELEVAALEDGYELRRSGEPVKGSLSEGEKTAIALCYFLSTLEAEGRKRQNLIVVIDDPVSSLDTKALNYSFSILKAALGDVNQLFLLTHNLHFMNEAKKWLKNKAYPRDSTTTPTATLLFLDAIQKNGDDGLSSSIKELPKYIRDYESEYQYLFYLVRQFAQSPDGLTGYLYVMPNAMRKVLEIFLAFKLPGSDGLSSKVATIATKFNHGLDEGCIHALDRLVQLESHADNLDDLITFSSMTIEETKNAADILLKMMSALDEDHYRRLCNICREDSLIDSSQPQPVSINPSTEIGTATFK
ncbi:AAA family ATPase [Nitrosospira sp. NpAV]|uniref:AAA family ATPase n=1 Tax=Nitrosospira sp. NpAV TaxID=58133 RepID=UPI0005A11907|nr:AAA family ATPase [Nitrosospira sp. NpAV]KIO48498.1 hypothetical protein SQ11_12305 [Nitrosospira sp. NpAV]